MLCCEGNGPGAGAAANVKDTLSVGLRLGGAVESLVLDEPHAVLEIWTGQKA